MSPPVVGISYSQNMGKNTQCPRRADTQVRTYGKRQD